MKKEAPINIISIIKYENLYTHSHCIRIFTNTHSKKTNWHTLHTHSRIYPRHRRSCIHHESMQAASERSTSDYIWLDTRYYIWLDPGTQDLTYGWTRGHKILHIVGHGRNKFFFGPRAAASASPHAAVLALAFTVILLLDTAFVQ